MTSSAPAAGRTALALLLALLLVPWAAAADPALSQPLASVDLHERLGELMPLDLPLVTPAGVHTTLGALVADRPLLLVPASYRCGVLCPLVQDGVAQGLLGLSDAPGSTYRVACLSFDVDDTAADARARQDLDLARLGVVRSARDDGPDSRWQCYRLDVVGIDRLLQAIGYGIARLGQGIAHPACVVVLAPGGRIVRYLYGIRYPARDLHLALLEAQAGHTSSPVDRVLLYCYHYDAASHRYGLAIAHTLQLTGVVILGGTVLAIVLLTRRVRRRQRALAAGAPPAPAPETAPA